MTYTKGKPIVIAVLDTGFGYKGKGVAAKLCKYGHKDFSVDQQTVPFDTVDAVPLDLHSHGTNVVGLIERQLEGSKVPYCFVIVKYFSEKQTGAQNLRAEVAAFEHITNIHAQIMNYSGGGPESAQTEYCALKKFTDGGGILVSAAGNEHSDIDRSDGYYYPAKYSLKNIVIVGNKTDNGLRVPSSNYGKDVIWETGLDQEVYGIKMTGTSQATAITTGKIVAKAAQVQYGHKDLKRETAGRRTEPNGQQKRLGGQDRSGIQECR